MPTPPSAPGWYDDPDGRRRWWDGRHWGAFAPWDEHGSPARPSEPQRLTLDRSLTLDPTAAGRVQRASGRETRPAAAPPRGRSAAGRRRDGGRGHERPAKRMALAYALLIVLGPLGAHRFYLGRTASATVQLMLSFAAAAALVVLAGEPSAIAALAVPAAAAAWWLVDLLLTAGMVREANRRAAMRPTAPGYDRGWPDP